MCEHILNEVRATVETLQVKIQEHAREKLLQHQEKLQQHKDKLQQEAKNKKVRAHCAQIPTPGPTTRPATNPPSRPPKP